MYIYNYKRVLLDLGFLRAQNIMINRDITSINVITC